VTDDEHRRLTAALARKAAGLPRAGYSEDEWLAVVVGTVVADTAFVLDGTVPVEAYEEQR
jgi:hypothetical protein